jgi:glycosyltransferase involved in cell wall biosynthesis
MHIALYFTTLGGGGTERVLVRLATQFARMGHKVDLVLMRLGDHAYAHEIHPSVRIVDLRARRMKASLPAFWRYLRRERPDVLISAGDMANGFAGWARLLLLRKPLLVLTQHGSVSLVFDNSERAPGKVLVHGLRLSQRLADAIVGVSAGVAETIRRIPGVRREKVHVIHNPAWLPEIDAAAQAPIDLDWFAEKSTPVIVSVGRLEKVKDFPTLLRALALLRERREARLLILGEGSERPMLERLVSEFDLKDHVRLPGFVDNPFAYMARADLFVLSSIHEGFGNVVIEAMACGTPVVSTDCPTGPGEILKGGSYGVLVPVGDAEAMARAIARQLDHPSPADTLRARAREFSAEASATAYIRLIETARESGGSG